MPESRYSLGISGKNGLIDKSPGNISVVLDAAVAEEWPPAAHILAVLQVDIYHQALFFLIAGAVVELALRTGYETAAPELNASCLLSSSLYFILIFVHFFILLKVLVNIIVVFPIKVLLVLLDECSNMYGEV